MPAYPYSEKEDRGTWRLVHAIDTRKKVPVFNCPSCGQLCSLHGHEVDNDGMVSPRVGCPSRSCSFDSYVELLFWNPYDVK